MMLPKQSLTVMVLVLLVMVSAVIGAQAQTREDGGRLTPEQTICSVFLGQRRLLAKANPKALPYLYTLLSDPSVHPRVPRNVLRVIGYAGTEKDARQIIAMAGEIKGTLDQRSQEKMLGIFECLALMTRRGIPEARTNLLDMASWKHWEQGPKWYSGDYIKEHPERRYDVVVEAIRALAIYGDQDVTKQVDDVLRLVTEDAASKSYLAKSLDAKAYRGLAKELKESETEKVTEADLRNLALIHDALPSEVQKPPWSKGQSSDASLLKGTEVGVATSGNVPLAQADVMGTAPKEPLSEADWGLTQQLIQDAVKAYEECRSTIERGDNEALLARLLDDGKPIETTRIEQSRAKYAKSLALEKEVFEALRGHNVVYEDFQVHRVTTYNLAGPAESAKREDIRAVKSEEVTVTWRLAGSRDVVEANPTLNRQRGAWPTVAQDATLMVVMKRLDGKWFWNPFGW